MDIRGQVNSAIERYGAGVPAQVVLGSASVILGVIFGPVNRVVVVSDAIEVAPVDAKKAR